MRIFLIFFDIDCYLLKIWNLLVNAFSVLKRGLIIKENDQK